MKKYDVCAVTGTYTNQQGEEKRRYKNVGVVLDNGDGPFILLERSFNPAGVPSKNGETILLSLFEPRNDDNQEPNQDPGQSQATDTTQPAQPIDENEAPF